MICAEDENACYYQSSIGMSFLGTNPYRLFLTIEKNLDLNSESEEIRRDCMTSHGGDYCSVDEGVSLSFMTLKFYILSCVAF